MKLSFFFFCLFCTYTLGKNTVVHLHCSIIAVNCMKKQFQQQKKLFCYVLAPFKHWFYWTPIRIRCQSLNSDFWNVTMQFLNGSLQTTKDIHLSILLQYGLIFSGKKRNNNHAGVPKINKIKNGGNCAKKCIFYDTLFTVERPLLIETDMIVCLETLQSLTCFFFKWWKREWTSERFSDSSRQCILQIRNCNGLPRTR